MKTEQEILQELHDLNKRWSNCQLCSLGKTSRNHVIYETVFNYKRQNRRSKTDIMFIGEAPGSAEDVLGRPFVGVSGRLLRNVINDTVFEGIAYTITNVLACRPPGNRDPSTEEANICIHRVLALIKILKPRMIVCIGNVASHFAGKHISEVCNIPIKNVYHPAFIIRKGGTASNLYKPYVEQFRDIFKEAASRR